MRYDWPMDTAVSFDPVIGDDRQGYEILPDGKVLLRVIAPYAKEVVIDQFGPVYALSPKENGMWEGIFDLGYGFKYFFLRIDGADVLSPYFPIGYGCSRPMNFVDVPVPEESAWDELRDVPHGAVTRRTFYSSVTGKYEACLVYTPPAYDESRTYPVLYLQHGYGENETGWVYQGHVARIADNLLDKGEMREMLIVMGNGMTRDRNGGIEVERFPAVLCKDLIPYIEKTYPVQTDKWSRAMAGLSMGSYQTSLVTLGNPGLFGYAGVFSGFLRDWRERTAPEPHLAILDDAETFNASFRVFYRAMGTEDTFYDQFTRDDEMLADKGLHMLRDTFPGAHDWTAWRRCIHTFLPLLFR